MIETKNFRTEKDRYNRYEIIDKDEGYKFGYLFSVGDNILFSDKEETMLGIDFMEEILDLMKQIRDLEK